MGLLIDGASYCKPSFRIDNNGVIPSSAGLPMTEVQVEHFPDIAPMAVPVPAAGNSVSSTRADIKDSHCLYGHAIEFIFKETERCWV